MKKCKIFYATVVESDHKWAIVGQKNVEPIEQQGYPQLGKPPDYCCEKLRDAIQALSLGLDAKGIYFTPIPYHASSLYIKYCPFCGAEILCVADLRLRVVKYNYTPEPREEYRFERA